jgi:DNA polymerase-3 subunit gamma/tau
MDAASNNSVDDIRELRESVVFAPVSGRHKVYILDEAHMLSQAAWNAFLKTLEEPPPSTVFVLATTEAGKVPATVVDRCHRFDFHRPTVEQIASVVLRAAAAESIEIPPEAVAAISRSATGSFRDALGTLEQLVTYSGTRIELADVLAVLGVADEQLLADAFDAVQGSDARGALLTVARCVEGGRDAGSFTRDLEGRARELLVVQTLGEVPSELSLTPEIDERLGAQAQHIGRAEVVRVLDLLGAALEGVRAGGDPRTQLELALVKAATPQTDGSTRALLARIERLEQSQAGAGVSSERAPLRSHVAPPLVAEERGSHEVGPPVAMEEKRDAQPSVAVQGEGGEQPSVAVQGKGGEQPSVAIQGGVNAQPSVDGASAREGSPELRSPLGAHDAHRADEPQAVAAVTGTPDQQDGRAAVTVVEALPANDLDGLWQAVHESVRAEHSLLGAVLNEASPAILTDEELTLAFPSSAAFHKRKAEDPANRVTLIETLKRLTGRRYRVAFELRDDLPSQEGPNGSPPTEEETMARLVAELDAEELPEDWLQQQKGGE